MTTQTEVLRLALEALEDIANETYDSWTNGAKAQRIAQCLIPTIKEALAQPEQEPVAWPCVIETADFEEDTVTLKMQSKDYSVGVGLHWLSTTPSQPKEPEQRSVSEHVEHFWTIDSLEQAIYESTQEFVSLNVMEWLLNRLNTIQPQRTWIRLTKEEVDSLTNGMVKGWVLQHLVTAIEAKLKEKNT